MHKYLQYKPGQLNPKNYQYKIPSKYPLTKEKAQALNHVPGKITYFHQFPNNPNQINYGHKLYRHIKLGFCTYKHNLFTSALQTPEFQLDQQINYKKYSFNNINIIANIQDDNQTISYTIDQGLLHYHEEGTRQEEEGTYALSYTCRVCETKQARNFTKNAYHNGVVLIRCEGCEKLHLIADNLGWFEDDPLNVEFLKKGQQPNSLMALQKEDIRKIIEEF